MHEIDFEAQKRERDEKARIEGIKRGIAEESAKEKPDHARLNALRRNLAGAEAIVHLVDPEAEKRAKRMQEADEVSALGRRNREATLKAAERERLKGLEREAIAAQNAADEAQRRLQRQEGETAAPASILSDEEMRAIIEKETGKKPHWNLGHDKLVEMYEALR